MAICGFCKNEVTFEGFFTGKKKIPKTPKMVLCITDRMTKARMYSCPHCDSVLGYSQG